MALKVELKPRERIIIGQVVIRNDEQRTRFFIEGEAPILREKDILQPDDANTPARRIYFPVMMMYLDESSAEKFYDDFAQRLTEFMGAIRNPDILTECVTCSKHVLARQYYKALMGARKIVEYEEQRLGNVASGVQDGGDAG